jgi:hypothetical protein
VDHGLDGGEVEDSRGGGGGNMSGHSAGIRIKFRLKEVLWTDWPERNAWDFHGFGLWKHDMAAKVKIARMLRRMPKKWNRYEGRTAEIYNLPEVTSAWY